MSMSGRFFDGAVQTAPGEVRNSRDRTSGMTFRRRAWLSAFPGKGRTGGVGWHTCCLKQRSCVPVILRQYISLPPMPAAHICDRTFFGPAVCPAGSCYCVAEKRRFRVRYFRVPNACRWDTQSGPWYCSEESGWDIRRRSRLCRSLPGSCRLVSRRFQCLGSPGNPHL